MNGTVTSFRKYDHLERLGHRSTQFIDIGLVHIFPKLDGTNASVFLDDSDLYACSRNRVLSGEDDNAGFYAWANGDAKHNLSGVLSSYPGWILYGEWMVPHTLKTYRPDVWRKFWIFDVYDREAGTYLTFDKYQPVLELAGLDVIHPLCTIQDPTEDQLRAQIETNTYLIEDNAGLGEGVVVKNYAWREHGRPWAKIVRNSFKEKNAKEFGVAKKNGAMQVEIAIAEDFVTAHLVGKNRAKVVLEVMNAVDPSLIDNPNWQQIIEAEHRGRVIPQLLGRVFHDIVTEEIWAILKKHKGATIDFGALQGRIIHATKALAADLF